MSFRIELRHFKQYSPPARVNPEFGFGTSVHRPAFSVHEHRRTTVQQFIPGGFPTAVNSSHHAPISNYPPMESYQSIVPNGRFSPASQTLLSSGRPPVINLFPSTPIGFPRYSSESLSAFESRRYGWCLSLVKLKKDIKKSIALHIYAV